MSLFLSPEEHAESPPSSWQVVKVANRLWALQTKDAVTLDTYTSKRDAEGGLLRGAAFNLYETERRWFAGEQIPQWRPYVEVKAEREKRAARI